MAEETVLVNRIQNRRGKRFNLPQPLRPGELGYAVDTEELFIGGEPDEGTPGFELYLGILNGITTLQQIIDNNTLIVSVTSFDDTVLEDIKTELSATTSNFSLYWDKDPEGYIFLLFETGEETQALDVINDTQFSSNIDEGFADNGTSYESSDVGLGVSVNDVGQVFLPLLNGDNPTHKQSSAISKAINEFRSSSYPFGLVTNVLNINITEKADLSKDDILYSPTTFELDYDVVYPEFKELDNFFVSEDIGINNSFAIDFTVDMKDSAGGNYYSGVGRMDIIYSSDIGDASITTDITQVDNLSGTNSLDFNAVFVSPGTIKLEYRHNFPADPVIKVITKRWVSF